MATLQRYVDVRSTIQTGDAMAFRARGPWARLIEVRSYYSHVALLLWVQFFEQRRLMLAHAMYPTGVALLHASTYLAQADGRVDLYRADHARLAREQPTYQGQLADFCAQAAGVPYDTSGVLGFALRWFRQSASRYYCSELIAAAWQSLGQLAHTAYTPQALVEQPLYVTHESLTGG